VYDLMVNASGLIFTSHASDPLIRVFNPQGRLLRTFGRRGQGPGELSPAFDLLAAIGDTIVVRDQNSWELKFFLSDGRYVRTLASGVGGRTTAYIGADRALIEKQYWTSVQRPERVPGRGPVTVPVSRDSTVFLVFDGQAKTTTRIVRDSSKATVRYTLFVRVPAAPGEPAAHVYPQPFMHHSMWPEDPSGRSGSIVLPYNEWGGRPGQIKVTTVEGTGTVSDRVITLEARRLRPSDVDQWIKQRVDQLEPAAARGGMPRGNLEKQFRDSLRLSEYLPAAEEILVGRDGSIWIRPSWSATDWSVVLAGSTPAFTVRVPTGARVMQPGSDVFWAVLTDQDGLPVIVRYRIAAPL
jgi:hypothetical protein